jgi:hypothetical protein
VKSDIERYRANLRDELNGAALYEALAAAETDSLLSPRLSIGIASSGWCQ